MLRHTSSPLAGGGGLVLGLARALGWKPPHPKYPILSAEWLAERDAAHADWRSIMSELAPPQAELPSEPDSSQPLSGITVTVSDDLDVRGFISTGGLPGAFHRSPAEDNAFVAWLRQHGAFVVGKLKCTVPFARTECTTILKHSAAIAVTSRACDVALSGSILGPAGLTAPVSEDVFVFKPSASALPSFEAPFSSSRYSLGLVFRHVSAAERLWAEMSGKGEQSARFDDISQEDYIKREVPDYLVSARRRQAPVIRVGVPAQLIDNVLSQCGATDRHVGVPLPEGKQPQQKLSAAGAGDALAQALATKIAAEVYDHSKRLGIVRRVMTRLGAFLARLSSYQQPTQKPQPPPQPSSSQQQAIVPIEIVKLNLVDWDIQNEDEGVVALANTIVNYELSRKLEQKHGTQSGMLEQLPKDTVAAIQRGMCISDKQHESAMAQVRMLRHDMREEMSAVDCICVPLLAPPYENHNLRSIAFSLPFALPGNCFVSFRLPIGNAPEYDAVKKLGVVCDDAAALESSGRDEKKCGFRLLKGGEKNKKVSTPILLTALPGQDSILLEAARSLLQRKAD